MGTSSETATYVGGFSSTAASNKPDDSGADGKRANGAAEIRQLKKIIKDSFANVTGAVTASHTELNYLDGVTGRSGSDTTLITGTAGTSGDLVIWDANGDAVDGPTPPTGDIVGTTDTQTLTNKTLDGAAIGTTTKATVVKSAYFRADQGAPNDADSSTNGYAFDTDGDTGLFAIGSGASSTGLGLYTNNTQVVYLQASNARVGIGESSPDYKLDVNGSFGFTPGSSVTPADNGDVVFELTNNTTLTIKAKGSDGTVRTGTVTLA